LAASGQLAERIEERLGELQQEIVRLKAANAALALTSTDAAAADPAARTGSYPRAPHRAQELPVPNRRRASDQAAARVASKPAAAALVALARELDAGLRNRP